MVGAGTVIADNPQLTCRIAGGRDPVRVVIDAKLRTAPTARIYRQRSKAATIIVTTQANLARARRKYERPGVEAIAVKDREGELALDDLMTAFGRRGWNNVLIEGGANLAGSALAANIVDRVAFFIAPKILSAGLLAIDGTHVERFTDFTARQVGDDWLLEARLTRVISA